MKILVTGGGGYKGIKLTEQLLNKGYFVTVLDNFMYGHDPIFNIINNSRLNVLKMDIRNLKKSHVSDFDVVFHLAGISGMPACAANPDSAENINVKSTEKLCSFLEPNQLLINASTTSFYGAIGVPCDETVKEDPVSIYGRTKLEAERICMQRENSISLRFATVFGVAPRMRNDLMTNDFVNKAINDRSIVIFAGHSKRTFIHVDDAISGYMFALDNASKMAGEVYNVGGNNLNHSKLDIANTIKKYVDYEIIDSTLPDLDVRDFLVSFDKISKVGFTPKLSLDDGINELVKLYRFYKTYSPFNII